MAEPLLVADQVSKAFPGVVALDRVDFAVTPGEVNALVGENGAGKSTLINLLSGALAPDRGEIRIVGVVLEPSPAAAHEAGIATIHQQEQLVPNMSVAENVMLGRWATRLGLVSKRVTEREAVEAVRLVAPDVDPRVLARRLSPAEAQLIEIARALSEHSRVLIMDEPTTSLSPPEVDRLFGVVETLKAQGLGVLFVSHWLEQVLRIADRITVLRDGRVVGSQPAKTLDQRRIVSMMVGRDIAAERPSFSRELGEPVLEVRGLSSAGKFVDVSFDVREGEIVALAGLVGAGRSEVAHAIFGIDAYDEGAVVVAGQHLPSHQPLAAIRSGLGLVPEDRHKQALIEQLSVSANVTLSVLDFIAPHWLLSRRRERQVTEREFESLRIKARSPAARVSTLSGGNQQKVVIGRWLARDPRMLILDEPTKGVDVGAKAEIHTLIGRLAERGVGVLLISSELPEVMLLSHRVLVMRAGRLAAELPREELSQELIMSYGTTSEGVAA